MCTATSGLQSNGPDQRPCCIIVADGAGTVTVTGALVAVFPARSAATAFTICDPGAAPAAFQSTL